MRLDMYNVHNRHYMYNTRGKQKIHHLNNISLILEPQGVIALMVCSAQKSGNQCLVANPLSRHANIHNIHIMHNIHDMHNINNRHNMHDIHII